MNCIVSFSSRKNGNCSNIAERIKSKLLNSEVYSFADFHISPCRDCCYECFRSREACPHFDDMEYRLLDAVCRSEAAYFIVPNYCDYPCANFFIFNERSQCYFQGHPKLLEQYLNVPKKFVVVSNSVSGNFRAAFTQHSAGEPELLFLSTKKFGKSSISGDLLDSDEACVQLRDFITRCSNYD